MAELDYLDFGVKQRNVRRYLGLVMIIISLMIGSNFLALPTAATS